MRLQLPLSTFIICYLLRFQVETTSLYIRKILIKLRRDFLSYIHDDVVFLFLRVVTDDTILRVEDLLAGFLGLLGEKK